MEYSDNDLIYIIAINVTIMFVVIMMAGVFYVANNVRRVEKVLVLTGINMLSGSTYLQHLNSLKESGLIDD
jgi:uncharacterized membrane protein YgdD (TMEM256/DUF423 family)